MKKTVRKLLALSMAVVMTAGPTGCSGSAETTTAADPKVEAQVETKMEAQAGGSESQASGAYTVTDPVEITFATQSVGITAYAYASTMTGLSSDTSPSSSVVNVTTISPGDVGPPAILENKQCNVTISNGTPAKWAAETGVLKNSFTESVRGLTGGPGRATPSVIFTQSFVNKAGITAVEELVTRKYPVYIAVKLSGAFGELACNKVFEVLGVSYEDIESWGGSVIQTGSDAIVSLLRDGKADMVVDHVIPGQSVTPELCMTTKIHLPQLSDDALGKLIEEGFDYTVIPTGTWLEQEMETKTVGSPQVILVSADLDDAIVYTMVKALCENTQALVNASVALEAFGPETAWEPVKLGTPIHPGAEAYYREMGYIKQVKLV